MRVSEATILPRAMFGVYLTLVILPGTACSELQAGTHDIDGGTSSGNVLGFQYFRVTNSSNLRGFASLEQGYEGPFLAGDGTEYVKVFTTPTDAERLSFALGAGKHL